MHKTRFNTLRLALELAPRGPLLIKSGEFSPNPSLPDMQFVRTYYAGKGETVYIPGSSLKGVIRGFVEQALRTLNHTGTWQWACPTFPSEEQSCGQRLAKKENSWEVYQNSCGACRLFGHTRLRGRVAFTDLFPVDEVKTEVRYGVAISRLSQAVAQGPFEMEVAVAGSFAGLVIVENYELWHLGLLAVALEAMNQGLLKVGFGKNRGFGQVEVTVKEAQVDEVVPVAELITLRGLYAFVDDRERERYGLEPVDGMRGLPEPAAVENLGFYLRRTYDRAGWAAISRKAIEALVTRERV